MLSDISETLDETKTSLNGERQQRQQIQDQLRHANKEMERLQQELTHVRHAAEKKVIGFFLKVFIQILNPCKLCLSIVTLNLRLLCCWPRIVDTDTLSAS